MKKEEKSLFYLLIYTKAVRPVSVSLKCEVSLKVSKFLSLKAQGKGVEIFEKSFRYLCNYFKHLVWLICVPDVCGPALIIPNSFRIFWLDVIKPFEFTTKT